MGIFDKFRKKKIIERKEISQEPIKIMGRKQRSLEHGKEKGNISAKIVTTQTKTLVVEIKPKKPKSKKTKKRSK